MNIWLPDDKQDADSVPIDKEWERYEKPCPNCGSMDTWILEVDDDHFRIECDECGRGKNI